MATFRQPILGALQPDSNGKTWWEPASILFTNDRWKHQVFRIDQDGLNNAQLSTREGGYGKFAVPKNYVGTPKVVIVWSATITTAGATVRWEFDYRAVGGDQAESLDQSGDQESVGGTQDVADAANERRELVIDLTAGNFAVDDTVEFWIGNDGTDAADDAACARVLHDLLFQYADA